MHIYMKIDKVKGGVKGKKHDGWIELESFNLGVHCLSQMAAGDMANRQFSLPVFIPPSFTKKIDASSGALFNFATSGQVIPEITIVITGNNAEYLKYTLSEVIITSRNLEAFNGAGVIESGTFSFSKILETSTDTDAAGKAQAPFTAGYDLKEAKKL